MLETVALPFGRTMPDFVGQRTDLAGCRQQSASVVRMTLVQIPVSRRPLAVEVMSLIDSVVSLIADSARIKGLSIEG